MSDYRWTMTDGIDINAMEFSLIIHIDDAMKDVLECARFGEVKSITVNYDDDIVRIYRCYKKEAK